MYLVPILPSRTETKQMSHDEKKTQKKHLLTVLRAKSALLREQLEAVNNGCKVLEAQLARNISPAVYPTTGIHNLFPELLLEIFRFSLLDSHRHIGNLLMVCKRWYAMVNGFPILWTTPVITVSYGEIDMTRELAYYADCVKHSRDLPLSVIITALSLFDSLRVRPRGAMVTWDDSAYCEKFWRCVKGKDDGILKRWKSLHITIPFSSMRSKTLAPLFAGRAPNLSCLALNDPFRDAIWKPFVTNSPIEFLCCDGILTKGPSSNSLKNLKDLECFDDGNLSVLSSIPSLESLIIWSRRAPGTINKAISLPNLRNLKLVGEWDPEVIGKFNLPKLFSITFVTRDNFTLTDAFKASPQELHWETIDDYRLPRIGADFNMSIGSTLAKHKSIKVVRVPRVARDLMLDVFDELINYGGLSMKVMRVRVLDDNSIVFDINVL